MIPAIASDVRHAVRALRRSPGVVAAIATLLALGLGVNGATLSVFAQLRFWEPPGVRDASNVWRIHHRFTVNLTGERRTRDAFSYPEVRELIRTRPAGIAIAGHYTQRLPFGDEQTPQEVAVTAIAGDYFGLLGVRASVGRLFGAGEYDGEGITPVVVISHRFWERNYARSRDVLHQSLRIGSHQFAIVGVAAPQFQGAGMEQADLWIPHNAASDWSDHARQFRNVFDLRFRILARVPRLLVDETGIRASRSLRAVGAIRGRQEVVSLVPLARIVGPQTEESVSAVSLAAAGASSFILLVACANIAHLLILRAAERKREIATRAALGASRSRLVGMFLVESMLLSLVGTGPALIIGAWARDALRRTLLPGVNWTWSQHGSDVIFGIGVLAACVGLGVGVSSLLGLDWRNLAGWLNTTGSTAVPRAARSRAGLLVVQIALSVMLMVGASLFVRSYVRALAVWGGAGAQNVVLASATIGSGASEEQASLAATAADLASRMASFPDVATVARSAHRPVTSVTFLETFLPGRDSVPTLPGVDTHVAIVSPRFLEAMGIALLEGRDFREGDVMGAESVVLVSRLMARTYWPGQNALGKCLIVHRRDDGCRIVVGVVADARAMQTVERPTMRYYLPIAQMSRDRQIAPSVIVRARSGRAREAAAATRSALLAISANAERWHVDRLADVLEPQLRPWRLSAQILSVLALLSVVVAGLGTYAAAAYATALRTPEIGVRRALGAGPIAIVRLVLGATMRFVLLGIALGTVLSVAFSRVVTVLLFGVVPNDIGALLSGGLLLGATAMVAAIVPALRAIGVSPRRALNAD